MSTTMRDWCQCAWKEISALPGVASDELRHQWESHAAREEVIVTFFGPYDSGKSSLLKRLLVDDNQPIPGWLTVSARRETFEKNEAEVKGVVVRDTPGIAGGNAQHAEIADDSLALSDVVVLVLPPQLITSNKATFINVLNGGRFFCPGDVAYARQGFGVALSRMDEAGVSPEDDPEGYQALAQRKTKELDDLLRSEGVPKQMVALSITAADPSGLVGNSVPSDRHVYDEGRQWDGMESFADFLRSLPARKNELRQHAEIRFLGAELGGMAGSLEELHSMRRIAVDVAANEVSMHALSEERLGALLDAAKADLYRRIDEEVAAATRRGAADEKELRRVIDDRLEAALDRWSTEHDAAFEALLREADGELKVRRDRPASKTLWESLDDNDTDPAEHRSSKKDGQEVIGKVQKLTRTLHKGYREAHQAFLGMTIVKSRSELQRLRQSGSFEEYVKETSKKATRFSDASHATTAKWSTRLDTGFAVAVPAILELGGLLNEAWSENKVAQQRAERREKVRRSIEKSSSRMAESAWRWWCDDGLPAAVREAFSEARQSAEAVKTSLEAEAESIRQSMDSVNECLHRLKYLKVCQHSEESAGFDAKDADA